MKVAAVMIATEKANAANVKVVAAENVAPSRRGRVTELIAGMTDRSLPIAVTEAARRASHCTLVHHCNSFTS